MPDFKKIYAIKKANEGRILKVCPNCPNTSGIYFLLREENGFKYAYIGQAVRLRERLGSHLSGYQHIDLSIKKHGLWSEENQTGWKIYFLVFPKDQLDEQEQYYIKKYANAGYQMRNATAGSQGVGKHGLDNQRPNRGYYDGLEQGEKRLAKELKHIINTHLVISLKKNTKISRKALEKFWFLLDKSE